MIPERPGSGPRQPAPIDPFLAYGSDAAPIGLGAEGEPLDIAKYVKGLRRRWPLLLVCVLIGVAFSLVRYSLTPKMYESGATIQIERKRLSLLTLGQAGWLEDWWNMEYYPTQYRLLRSRGMAERVVLNLRLHEDPNFNDRAASLLGGDIEPVDVSSSAELARLAGRVQAGLSVKPIEDTQLVQLTYRSQDPEIASRIANGYAEVFIEWGIETRTTTVGQASSFLAAQIGTLRKEIEERQKQLNAFSAASDQALDQDGQALLQRRQSLETQFNSALAERINKEAAYRELVASSAQSVANSASSDGVADLRSELFRLESEYRSKLETYTPDWPEMVQLDQQIVEKRAQLQQAEQEAYREEVGRAYTELQQAQRRTAGIDAELERLRADAQVYNSDTLEYENLKTLIESRRQLLTDLVKRQSETEVASRIQGSQESNIRVVERAVVPSSPYAPVLRSDLTRSVALALMVGLGAIFLLEYFDRTVKSPEELESLTGLPTLAVIPDIEESSGGLLGRYAKRYGYRYSYGAYGYGYGYGYGYSYGYGRSTKAKKGKAMQIRGAQGKGAKAADEERRIELMPHFNPRVAVSEAYRSLRTALMLSTADDLQVIAMTSAVPGEGKTASTTNLATVIAQLGRRVLVVDADLRRPRMHKVFRTSNRHGLVNYLTAHADLEGLVFETPVPNLFLCPSGPIPPNPSELLSSERMRSFLAKVRDRFDYVVIDTPPTLPVADAIILGTMVDAVLVCARAGILVREDAKLCRERLSYAGIRLVGTILNRYRANQGRRYDKRYRYYGTYEEPRAAGRSTSTAA
ncbi:MAG: polysaccharide biosynthesis tyrosine autokinase [Thermoanaerobaculia bacterium]|nr:polysaccharide biosynthesis tyrosine autokinase [Thermoanaerobaculia bacterium]